MLGKGAASAARRVALTDGKPLGPLSVDSVALGPWTTVPSNKVVKHQHFCRDAQVSVGCPHLMVHVPVICHELLAAACIDTVGHVMLARA